MKIFKLRKTNLLLLYFFIILYLEITFKILTKNNVFNINIIFVMLFSLFVSFFLTIISSLFNDKVNKVVFYILVGLLCLLFSVEFCVYKMFGFYFDLSLLSAADQVVSFASDGVTLILENILGIMFIFIPFVLAIIFKKYIKIESKWWRKTLLYLVITIVVYISFLFSLNINKKEDNSSYMLFNNVNNIELSIKKLGVINAFTLDLKRTIFGFNEDIVINKTPIDESKEEVPITYDYNNLDIDFDSINMSDSQIIKMNEYFKNESGTLQNEYTGYFKDKNLILFMAESFNEIAVDKELTPTLYKLVNSGFVFENFYTPTISSTIGGEFQELTGLVASSGFIAPWKSGGNSFPFGIANSFKNSNFGTFAYHNHNYTFQSRNKYLKAIGFDNFLGCRNGLEDKINCNQWPESDVEMINATVDDYINSEGQFFTYYVTVSGHGDYGWANSAMARKHKDEVIGLPYSEKVLAYLAANIELDKALELLIEKLDSAGKLDDTVIALVGDHYPYYLSLEEVNEVASYTKDKVVEINRSNFILWNNKMKTKKIEKVGSQIDVLPTIYNLFGIKYDSRLIIGKDILSTEPGLAIFGNRSWVSDCGTYFSSQSKFVENEACEISDDYVKNMNLIVANKMNMSKLILEKDYYKYFQ